MELHFKLLFFLELVVKFADFFEFVVFKLILFKLLVLKLVEFSQPARNMSVPMVASEQFMVMRTE